MEKKFKNINFKLNIISKKFEYIRYWHGNVSVQTSSTLPRTLNPLFCEIKNLFSEIKQIKQAKHDIWKNQAGNAVMGL